MSAAMKSERRPVVKTARGRQVIYLKDGWWHQRFIYGTGIV